MDYNTKQSKSFLWLSKRGVQHSLETCILWKLYEVAHQKRIFIEFKTNKKCGIFISANIIISLTTLSKNKSWPIYETAKFYHVPDFYSTL